MRSYPFDVSPVNDDRPFFFKNSFWWHLVTSDPVLKQYSLPVMEYSLLMLLAIIGVACVACVYVPLRLLEGRSRKVPAGSFRYGAFFSGIGLGYLAVEMALLQKFGLFLGHPNYSLSVVLASLLLSTGLGSLFSRAILTGLGNLRVVSYVLAALVLAEHTLLLPKMAGLIRLPFPTRVLIVMSSVAPLGLCLGTFFPTALERLKSTAPTFVPWAWGINGIFSVLAPVLSVGVSMTWGINALLLGAVPVYVFAALAIPQPAIVADAPT